LHARPTQFAIAAVIPASGFLVPISSRSRVPGPRRDAGNLDRDLEESICPDRNILSNPTAEFYRVSERQRLQTVLSTGAPNFQLRYLTEFMNQYPAS